MTIVGERTDEAGRRLVHDALDETMVVEAAAGTGKTTELVKRIVRVLAEGRAEIRDVVAVTFTERAAGELKLRLRQQLEHGLRVATDGGVAARLRAAVQRLEEAHISTIHGFCADLLRERPVEAGVDPLFRVLTEGQANRLFDEAFAAWLQDRLEQPPEGVRRSLRRISRSFGSGSVDGDGPMERLRRAGFELAQWRDFRAGWARRPFARAEAIARLVELVHALADTSAKPSYVADNLFLDTEPARRLSRELRARGGASDLDAMESHFIELRRNRDFKRGRKGSGPTYSKGSTRAQVLAARGRLVLALNEFQIDADADLAALLHDELLACVDSYTALKEREGAVDFLDLLLRARDLVRDNAEVRADFQRRFTRIFVDEFQDTDPLQAELLLLLAADDPDEAAWMHARPVPGKLFIVGDPKQSIYRFRRADVTTYRDVCALLERSGAVKVELRKSFRGVPNIQRFVNAAFTPVMDGDEIGLQARYVPLEAARDELMTQPSVVALPVPEPYGHRFIAAREIERSLPDAVGAYVEWLITGSGWLVTERRGAPERVPIRARHICILFRRFVSYGEDITRAYVQALEARGVKHLLVGGRAFHDREEIETLRAALMAVEWPDDQLSVFAALRGGLFAIGDDDLLEYHHLARGFHPFRIPDSVPAGLAPIREALTFLASLHRERNVVPVADTVAALLAHTRAHVGLVLRPGGEQALANVLHVAELARQYELDGGMSFRGFVETLRQAASTGESTEAPILEEGSDGVRLMTVHKAKGLEFPVVILADITARLTPYEASRHVDPHEGRCALRIGGWSPWDLHDNRETELLREQKEGERVAYVAATRARDLLVVPAVGDEPYAEGWVAPLNAALYPPESARRVHAAAVGCPEFTSRDSVLNRPEGDPASPRTVCPGEHALGAPDAPHSVVWWSPEPNVLRLGAEAGFGLRRDDLIVKDVSHAALQGRLDDYRTWRTTLDSAVAAAREPSVHVLTATEAAADIALDLGATMDIAIVEIPSPSERPGGARFGALVHALLADVPLADANEDIVARLGEAHGRVLGADAEEIAAGIDVVRRVLIHPVLRAASRAAERGECHREAPVTLRLKTGTIVEGNVDLAFLDNGEYVVVDFKTDDDLDGAVERYSRQLAIYGAAIAAATGTRARGILVRV